jgi:hypothetical protein
MEQLVGGVRARRGRGERAGRKLRRTPERRNIHATRWRNPMRRGVEVCGRTAAPCGRNETEGTVNVGRKDRTASEALNHFERVARAIQERARRLEILDRRALARREAEDRRLQEAERR